MLQNSSTQSLNPASPVFCAVIMCVYSNDSPIDFDLAICSIRNQALPSHLKTRLYLCVDGMVSEALESVIVFHEKAIYKVLRNSENCGLAISLNRLINSLEDEEYVARMDADDLSLPKRIITQCDFLRLHLEVDLVGAAITEFYKNRKIGIRFYPAKNRQCLDYLSKASPFAHPTVCFRRSIFDSGIRYPIKHQNEDIALWFLLAQNGFVFSNLQEPLLIFKITDNTFQRRNRTKAIGEFLIYKDGILNLGYPRWKIIYPLMRLMFRMIFPGFLIGIIYRTNLRKRILNK